MRSAFSLLRSARCISRRNCLSISRTNCSTLKLTVGDAAALAVPLQPPLPPLPLPDWAAPCAASASGCFFVPTSHESSSESEDMMSSVCGPLCAERLGRQGARRCAWPLVMMSAGPGRLHTAQDAARPLLRQQTTLRVACSAPAARMHATLRVASRLPTTSAAPDNGFAVVGGRARRRKKTWDVPVAASKVTPFLCVRVLRCFR